MHCGVVCGAAILGTCVCWNKVCCVFSHRLLEGLPGVVLISLSGVTASSGPLQVGIRGTLLLVDCGVASNTAGFGCDAALSMLGFTVMADSLS